MLKYLGPRTEVSGPMVRTALGPKCLGVEVSGHFGTGAEVSRVRCVHKTPINKKVKHTLGCLKVVCFCFRIWHVVPL